MPEDVRSAQVGHLPPVDVVQELPPAEQLADEALDRRQRDVRPPGSGEDGGTGLRSGEQAEIERDRQERVGKHPLAVDEGVLVGAELRQAMGDEVGQGGEGVGAGHRPGEIVEAAGMAGEAGVDLCQHLAGDHVRREGRRRREAVAGRRDAAVLGVVAPGAAGRSGVLVAWAGRATGAVLHEPARATAFRPVPGVETKLPAAGGPGVEGGRVGEPQRVGDQG